MRNQPNSPTPLIATILGGLLAIALAFQAWPLAIVLAALFGAFAVLPLKENSGKTGKETMMTPNEHLAEAKKAEIIPAGCVGGVRFFGEATDYSAEDLAHHKQAERDFWQSCGDNPFATPESRAILSAKINALTKKG